MIATREATLREISRELHDEFGQILTAMGSMLSRAGRHTPDGSPLRAELREIGEIAQTTLDNVRGLSQSLHPSILEEAGLERTIEWYLSTLERQLDVAVSYERSGPPSQVDSAIGIHVYRVLQEALNNVARHSGTRQAWVRLRFEPHALELEVEDHGKGFGAVPARHGLGLVAMRERAELVGGSLEFSRPRDGGTIVRLRVPLGPASPMTTPARPSHAG
jgi:signal transduction histidine kinase